MKTKKNEEYIYCNHCGQVIGDKGFPKADYVKIHKTWGYFSNKDLQIHEFNLCESCYDKMIENFKIMPTIKQNHEAM